MMDCLICGADAEQISTSGDVVGIVCPMCGEYDVSGSVIASGQLRRLPLEERGDLLSKARRSAVPGARPMITPYLLA
jgi:hypothetical protein